MCGGGGPCPVNRGGTCDCLMSALAFVILFFIFRATGVLDKIFYSLGYSKTRPPAPVQFIPTPGDITECSRNESLFHVDTETTTDDEIQFRTESNTWDMLYETVDSNEYEYVSDENNTDTTGTGRRRLGKGKKRIKIRKNKPRNITTTWTTVVYYLV